MSNPRVSIMMPCFNVASTLPMALASLVAQTFEDWECVVVDDGSTDATAAIVQSLSDRRIRFHRFDTNRGRGAARRYCLEAARGEWLAMLDADDWLFPDKLEMQLRAVAEQSEVAACATGMAVVDNLGRLTGVRGVPSLVESNGLATAVEGPMTRVASPPFAFPPSMVRMDIAKASGFDVTFRRTQDSDFLLRALLGRRYVRLPEIAYAYTEIGTMGIDKVREGYHFRTRMFAKYIRVQPMAALVGMAKTQVKDRVYQCAEWFGKTETLVRARSKPATGGQADRYERARRAVHHRCVQLFDAQGARAPESAAQMA